MKFVIYDAATRRIMAQGDMSADQIAGQARNGQAVLVTDWPAGSDLSATHMVADDLAGLVERPVAPIARSKATIRADGTDEAVISGIPEGAGFLVRSFGEADRQGTVEGGALTLVADRPARFVVLIDPFPAQAWQGTVDAA